MEQLAQSQKWRAHRSVLAARIAQESGAEGWLVGQAAHGLGTIVYFVCEDCAHAAKRAKEAGGRIVKDKFSIGDYGNIALVSDLDGNVVGFHSMS